MSVFFKHRRRDGDDAPPRGFAYDRVEGVIQLTLAFVIVGGAAVLLSSALFRPSAPPERAGGKPDESAQSSVAVAAKAPEPAPVESAPAAPAAAPFASPPTTPAPTTMVPLEPLAPPSPDMREKLVARQEAAPPPEARAYEAPAAPVPAPAAAAAPAVVEKPGDEPATPEAHKTEEAGRMAKCFLKLSGRVQNSGACRVDHTGAAVVFHLPGKTLEIAHNAGRVWTATLGGRHLGKVYRTGACWGAKGFYACENG